MEKKLSICVAVYNISEEYLRQCIESIIKDKSPDIQIILGDDCSENGSGEICGEYAKKDSRILYIRQEKNGGVSRLRNKMLDSASGEYIGFIDGDDVVSGYCIQAMKTAADTGFDIVMFEWQTFEKNVPKSKLNGSKVKKLPNEAGKRFSGACLTGAPSGIEAYGIKASTPSSVCNKIYKREFINQNNLRFRDGLKKSQDVEFNTNAFSKCKMVGYLEETLYFYRKNQTSVCNRYSGDIRSTIKSCMDYDMENLKNLFNGDKKYMDLWRRYKLIHFLTVIFSLDIFHPDNPKSKSERKKDFLEVVDSRLYRDFFESFDFEAYGWNERKLILNLASRRKFALLDFMYKHPISFKIYGHIKKIIKIKQ